MSRRARRQKLKGTPSTPLAHAARWPRARQLPTIALLFASGLVALVYETLWVKQLGRVVGVEVHATAIAIGAFFAGLALGGALLGRLADRAPRPVRLYALLEAGVAVVGVLCTLALARSAQAYVVLQEAVGPFAWALPFGLVATPAFLMGGTLPALVRSLQPDDTTLAPVTGVLYAANTTGAIVGTLATPFLLVPAFGVKGTGFVAAILGGAVAAAAVVLDRRIPDSTPPPPPVPVDALRTASRRDARLALALYAIAGGVALGYEVVWFELLVQFMSTRSYAFAVMLTTYLSGLALGSYLFMRLGLCDRDPWRVLGGLLAGAGIAAVGAVALLGPWLPDAQTFAGMWAMRVTGRETVEAAARFAVAAIAVVLVPTMLLGAAFPAAARLIASAPRVGQDIGRTLALNTAGGIAGTLLTGFVLVPWLGLVRSLGCLAIVGAVLGGLAIARAGRGRLAGPVVVAVAVAIVALTPRDTLATLLADRRGGTLVFYVEDTGGTVAVLQQPTAGAAFRRLYIQGVSNSGDTLPSLRYMRLQALLPLIVHPHTPRSALVLGFGTGITAGALLAYPSLERRVVAELLPSVVKAGPLFAGNLGAATDPRIAIRIGDGRHELLRSGDQYDLITLEPPPPSAAGVVNLYSSDFYALCRKRLAPGGLMAQWWPLPAQNDEDSRALVRSFLDSFPDVTLWTTELHEMLLLGAERPLALDAGRVAGRVAVPETARALAEIGIDSPEALLATFVTDRAGLERYVGAALPVTDDRPRIEHAAWVRRGEFQRVLPKLIDLASHLPLDAHDPMQPRIASERHELLAFYRAALQGYAGKREAAAMALREVFARDPENRYYRWVAKSGGR